jgi:hypothetical protein
VSERLGHSSIVITLNTYSHVLRGLQEEVAMKVDASLGAVLKAATTEDDNFPQVAVAPISA